MKLDGCNALITGASAGIGREFARQLAGRARSMILVARRDEKLIKLADQLQGPDDKQQNDGQHRGVLGNVLSLGTSPDRAAALLKLGFGVFRTFP